jgi:hypothetical protein
MGVEISDADGLGPGSSMSPWARGLTSAHEVTRKRPRQGAIFGYPRSAWTAVPSTSPEPASRPGLLRLLTQLKLPPATSSKMSIEFTKVEASTRQAFYDTLLMFWDQHWEKSSTGFLLAI